MPNGLKYPLVPCTVIRQLVILKHFLTLDTINMKAFKILAILIVILGIIYYQLDKRLFYYGRNDLGIYHLLPFNIHPEYQPPFEGGFALRNEDGLSIAGDGIAYPVNNRMIWIDKILKYGFSDQDLVAIAIDSNKTRYYLKFYWDPKKRYVDATMYIDNKPLNSNLYKWVDVDGNEDYIWQLELYRNYLSLTIFILSIGLFYILRKYRKLKSKDPRDTL